MKGKSKSKSNVRSKFASNERAPKGTQGVKDSRSKRINLDNERLRKFDRSELKLDKQGVNFKEKYVCDGSDKSNDPEWYAHSPQLLQAAANVGFYQDTGRAIPYKFSESEQYGVAGVMSIIYAPVIGGIDNKPIRQAMDSIYSYTVHANSRNTSYDATDEMLLILAGIEVMSAIALGIRAYGLMQLYDGQNRYLPDRLLESSGFNAADLRNNYSHMLFDLNNLIAQSRQIWIPNTMPLLTRRFWMNTNVYMDSESVKGQYYMYAPCIFWKYDDSDPEIGGKLVRTNWKTSAGGVNTWSDYLGIVQTLISNLINSQDRGLIFGDILKAYGEDRIYRLNELDPNYRVEPIYSKEVLTQIENATFHGMVPASITQNTTGDLVTTYSATSASGGFTSPVGTAANRLLLNFHQKEQPTPEQIIVATRMMASGQQPQFGSGNIVESMQPETCGTEIPVLMSVCMAKYTNGSLSWVNTYMNNNLSNADNQWSRILNLEWTQFDWAPHIYIATLNNTWSDDKSVDYEPGYVLADYDNYIFIDKDTLSRMHTAAVLSEFGVPMLA